MADYCKDCSIEWFEKDYRELAGLITEAEVKTGLGACVICEGCGFIRVDHEGKRLGEPDATTTRVDHA